MSTQIFTYIWLSPTDYEKKKVKELLDDIADFEFEDNSEPDDEGMIQLYAPETDPDATLTDLTGLGVSFYARTNVEEEGGSHYLSVAHRRNYTQVQEDGNGFPFARVRPSGNIDKEDLQMARRFWKLKAKVVASCIKRNPGTK